MAFLEWRKFHFFDLKSNVDGGKLSEAFKECKITSTSAGNNNLAFGDSLGQIHLVSRSWHVVTFRGYEVSATILFQLRNAPLLVSIGHDEPGVNPVIKVWDTSKLDKNGVPFCQRVTKALAGTRSIEANCLAVHDNLQLMAVGFTDGSLVLYRGAIARDRSSKQKVFTDLNSQITGLAFKASGTSMYLFASTENSVVVYNITHRDKEQKYHLDNIGCSKGCSVLAESTQESHFMVAEHEAIYCYTSDGRGPCYALKGEKTILEWFRNYLIIISKSNRPTSHGKMSDDSPDQDDLITILDIYNKFIVFQHTMPNIRTVMHEWGSLFIFDHNFKVFHLDEKDLQSKLSLLFKKNLYDVAIRIAKSQQYDSDGLVDIFKQYGDHLCEKGDYAGAMEQYIKTIGKLEPSYVIREFVDSQHLEKLIMYLQMLHKQGQATEDHTTLLLNCYTKLNNAIGQSDSLKEFILSKESDLNYDADVAIKVCRQGSPAEALMLAKKHAKHDWYIKIQIEDHQKYAEVLEYIANLRYEEPNYYMKKYGQVLVEHLPHESTQLLKRLCTKCKPENASIDSENTSTVFKADPEDYIHLFLNNSERLVEFLEYLISEGCILSPSVYNTLLEHYLQLWSTTESIAEKNRLAQCILDLLQNPDVNLDRSHALVVCNKHSFSDGILYIYEKQKLYQQILRYHLSKKDPNSVLACCTRFGHQDPSLWVQALWACVRDSNQPSIGLLNEILTVIAKEKLFSPQLVIDAVGTGNAAITLGHVRSYVMNELRQEMRKRDETAELTTKYRKDTDKLKKHLEELKSGVVRIQGAHCAACHHPLELPTIHFLCNHSFHQHCFQSFTDDENQCPTCQPENKDLLDQLKDREHNKNLHETFHFQLENAHDGFSLVAEYFGRGVFDRYRIMRPVLDEKVLGISERWTENKTKEKTISKIDNIKNYGPGAEARLRQTEIRKPIRIEPISEGRIRAVENRVSSSVSSAASSLGRSVGQNPFSSRHVEPLKPSLSTNPFEEDDYDDKMNPFKDDDEEELDKTNPFRQDYECDKNLNPFN